MFKKLLSVLVLSSFSLNVFAVEVAETIWNCSSCGDPYTDNGLQTFAQKAHNLAFGASSMDIHVYNGKTANLGPARWNGLKIANGRGQVVTVDFNPSWPKLFRMQLGIANNETLTFRVELPNSQLKFPKIKYRPDSDYVITPPPNMSDVDNYLFSAEASVMNPNYNIALNARYRGNWPLEWTTLFPSPSRPGGCWGTPTGVMCQRGSYR